MAKRAKASAKAAASAEDVMDLDAFVPALLTFVANRLTNSASATYRRRFGIGALDFRVMAMLSIEPGVSGARIAEVIDLDKAAVSRTLKSLEERGLAASAPGHGRARILTLTSKGQAVYGKAWQVAKERERRLLALLSADEQDVLRDLLRRLLIATPRVAELVREGKAARRPD